MDISEPALAKRSWALERLGSHVAIDSIKAFFMSSSPSSSSSWAPREGVEEELEEEAPNRSVAIRDRLPVLQCCTEKIN